MLAARVHDDRLVGAQAALQTVVDATAKELMIPGALVLMRTPQGQFTVPYGTTMLGETNPPSADTHFKIERAQI